MLLKNKILIVVGIINLFSLVSCNDLGQDAKQVIKEENKKQNVIIEIKEYNQEIEQYKDYKDITNNNEVNKIIKLLNDANWQENVQVSMSLKADYKIYIKESNELLNLYNLWISPDNNKVELTIHDESKYIQLNKESSSDLYKMLTGIELSKYER